MTKNASFYPRGQKKRKKISTNILVFFFWNRNSTVIKESKETTISFDGRVATLEILSAKSESSGTYKVTFSNSVSEESSSASLKVIGKSPSIYRGNRKKKLALRSILFFIFQKRKKTKRRKRRKKRKKKRR